MKKRNTKKNPAPLGALVDLTHQKVKRKYAFSRRAAAAQLSGVVDELLDLCPYSASPDDVNDALAQIVDRLREVEDQLVETSDESEA